MELLIKFYGLVVYDKDGRSYWPCFGYDGDIIAYATHTVALATVAPHLPSTIAEAMVEMWQKNNTEGVGIPLSS